MRFDLSVASGNVFTEHGAGYVRLGVVEYRENLIVTTDKIATGTTLRFPHPRLTRALTDARIGLEVMDTPAACRTFNILAAEGRKVAAAILIA